MSPRRARSLATRPGPKVTVTSQSPTRPTIHMRTTRKRRIVSSTSCDASPTVCSFMTLHALSAGTRATRNRCWRSLEQAVSRTSWERPSGNQDPSSWLTSFSSAAADLIDAAPTRPLCASSTKRASLGSNQSHTAFWQPTTPLPARISTNGGPIRPRPPRIDTSKEDWYQVRAWNEGAIHAQN